MSICLAFPAPKHQAALWAMREEFRIYAAPMPGGSGLAHCTQFKDWLDAVTDNADPATVRDGFVHETSLLAFDGPGGPLVGMTALRYTLNEHVLKTGGQIGLCIRPTMRGRGYGGQCLRLALQICRAQGIDRPLVTCPTDHAAALCLITDNGGQPDLQSGPTAYRFP